MQGITIRWKLDLILLNPPNHTSSIRAAGCILRCDPNLEASSSPRQRRLGKDRRLSVQTGFSALHEPTQQSGIWSGISSIRQKPRVLPVLEKGEVRARALRSWDRGTSGRWHIHCAIELPSHFDGIALETLIRDCWAKVEWGYGRILVRDGANAGWINYMLKERQKSELDGFVDCIIIESLHNPIADA